jgi:hypothetical protein
MRHKKAERVRENIMRVPDAEFLKKQEEEKKVEIWHKYLLKEKDTLKKQKLSEKKTNDL